MHIARAYKIPSKSFFLFGPRGVGKSTFIKQMNQAQLSIDLLNHETFLNLQLNPHLLEAKVASLKKNDMVFIDEIQKLPELLDEIHRLMEDKKINFILTGSSARKLKRAGANLLAGRAHTYKMFPLSLHEIGEHYSIETIMKYGGLPIVLRDLPLAEETLASYVATYLKEEIKEEALVRRVDEFNRFLAVSAQLNGMVLNIENIARESGKSAKTIVSWYQILEETLLVTKVNAYRPGLKVRETAHPKYFWFDHAIARKAAGLTWNDIDQSTKGFEFENLVFREIQVYMESSRNIKPIYYYNTPGVGEIDFLIEKRPKTIQKPPEFITIEVKFSTRWKSNFESASRSLKARSNGQHTRMIGVYLGKDRLNFNDFEVYPLRDFVRELFRGEFF